MRRPASVRAAVATLALLLAPLACDGDTTLSPPDGLACTRGTVAPGATVSGEVSEESCVLYSAYYNWETRAESWTLHAKANTAYVVRVRPATGDDDFSSEIVAYARSNEGDAMYATAGAFVIGPAARGREMFLVADRDRTFSLRVEEAYGSGYGRYELEVESCPVVLMKGDGPEEERTGIDVGDGCLSLGYDARHASRVRFVTFPAERYADVQVGAERTAGNGPLVLRLLGPDLDLAQTTDGSIWYNAPLDQVAYSFEPVIPRDGTYTLTVGTHRDSTAIVRAELLLASPFALVSRPEARDR